MTGDVTRLRPEPTVIAVVRGRELAIGVELYDLQCAALTTKRTRCGNPVELYGQAARWDERSRYLVDEAFDSFTASRYGTLERFLAAYERQRCPIHIDRDNPDAVPLDVWDHRPGSRRR